MRELGETLRRQREKLGLDLDQVERMTKIRKRYLIALEEGDWDVLPGEVYGRGFVRSYAEALGLDGLALLQAMDERRRRIGYSPDTEPRNGDNVEDQRPDEAVEERPRDITNTQPRSSADAAPLTRPRGGAGRASRKTPVLGIRGLPSGSGQIAIVVLILAALGVGWLYMNHSHGGSPSTDSNGTATSNTAGTSSGHANTGTTHAGNATAGPQNTANATNHAKAKKPAKPAVKVTTLPYQGGVQKYLVQTTDPLQVQLKAVKSRCWTKVVADGQTVNASDMVQMGDTRTWKANSTMTIILGAAYAVTLQINHQSVTLPAVNGAVTVQIEKTTASAG
jgi:cytoskeletal protein RodZ